MRAPVLIVANSARYLAESARASGLPALVVDAFGDLDTCQAATRLSPAHSVSPRALAAAAQELERTLPRSFSRWVYGAGFEAAPEHLYGLAGSARLCGNRADILEQMSHPVSWFDLLARLKIAFPETRLTPPEDPRGWLFKRSGSCGGLGVRALTDKDPAHEPGCYQRRIEGRLISLLFAADGRRLRVLGCNHLFAHDPAGGDFRYAGAIAGARPSPAERRVMERAAWRLTAALGLRGINGLDFVVARGAPLLLELNARPPATLELYESALPGGGLQAHLDACAGDLPEPTAIDLVHGQRLLYARNDLQVPVLDWPAWCRDRPPAGSRIPAGAPLCSVSAVGFGPHRVERLLRRRAELIRRRLETPVEEAA